MRKREGLRPWHLVFVVLLPAGLTGLLGSWTNVAATVMLVLGGYAWVVGGAVRRHGSVTIAAVGATVLAAAAGHAAYDAWQSRPEPPVDDLFLRPGAAVAVAVETGPDIQTAVKVALLLIAATLTVTACARLSADSQTR